MLDDPVVALDARRPVLRPLPHVAILRGPPLTQLFDEDYGEEEEVEARGEHTVAETFSECFAAVWMAAPLVFLYPVFHAPYFTLKRTTNLQTPAFLSGS